ncbi:hypothetical protein [Avibacterium sp. 21-599]|uniref:hypothetical protein n=1 Tax=Avibacterium sp. 21-599 TaxID=2911528 RepID=UPI00224599DA|nr:hypothetical protein [Avibacterium sp. 21-599]MCW9717624.1 hypothetical protein [Avibacterium sp. 21-599]
MKKLFVVLSVIFVSAIASGNNLSTIPKSYAEALKGLDIKGAELNNSFLSVSFNREQISKEMLGSVVRGFCYQMFLDKKFAKTLDLKRVMITNRHYSHSFNFETDVKQYCTNISKLTDEEIKQQFPFDRYVTEN